MATIRELQASFVAKANSMKSTIQGIKKDINGLQSTTDKTTGKMSKDFSKSASNISKSTSGIADKFKDMSLAASKSFENIGNSIKTVGTNLESWGTDIKNAGKTASKVLSPLTAFYATAAITGGSRMIANEQLDILMRNVFRTEEAYEGAWDAVNGLTKGTAFMNSDVGGWLSQLVQSNIELDKSEGIMKSILDFSVGSGQLGIEGEIHDIIMKAVRSGGWDQMTLDMLAQRGLNLAGHVANVLGITTESAQDMLKDGTISMEESLDYFVDAVQVGSEGAGGYFAKMAGSAQEGGETMAGAWINAKAALAQLGEDMWESGAWDALKEALNNIADFLYAFAPSLEPMAKIIASILATMVEWVQKLMTAFINLRPKTQALIASLSVIGAVLGPAIFMFGSFVGVVGKALKPLGSLFLWISKVLGITGKKGLGGVIRALASRFSFLAGPVGIAIGIITTLVSIFTIAYKKSETFRNFVDKLKDAFIGAYEKIKEFLTTNETLLGFLDSIKSGFQILKEKVSEAIQAVVSFFKDKFGEMKAFWDSDGQQLLQAVSNVFSGIWKVIKPIIDAVVTVVKASLPIIQTIFSVTFKAVFAIVKSIWGNIKGVIDGGLKIIMGLIQVFSGIFTGDFSKMWEGIKSLFTGAIQFIWNLVQLMFWGKLIKGVVGFVKGFSGPIGTMWTSIRELFSRVINWIVEFVKSGFTRMRTTISTISNGIQKVLDTVWNFILSIIKKVVQTIVNFVRDRFTVMRDTVSTIFNAVRKFISTVWNAIHSFFKTVIKAIVDFIKTRFTNLKNNVMTIFNAVRKFISTVWNAIFSFFKTVIKAIVDFVKTRFNNLKTNITNIFNGIKDTAKKVWNGIKDNVINPVKNLVKTAVDKFKGFKKSVTDTFKNIKDNVFGYVTDMIDKVKAMPGKMKDGIVKGASKVFDGMKSIANKMVEGLGKGVNGVITGVNWVLGKFNVKEKNQLNPWPVPEYAKGTKGHPGGPAIVGDGGEHELIQTPDGNMSMSPNKDTLVDLPQGSQVLSGKQTKSFLASLPHYKDGIFSKIGKTAKSGYNTVKGGMNAAKSLGKVGAKKTKDVALNVWDYAKKPGKLLNLALSKLGVSVPDASTLIGKMAKGGFSKVKTSAVDYIKGIFKKEEEAGGGPAPSGGASGWRQLIMRAAGRMGQSISSGEINGIIKQIARESGGNQSIVQSKAVRDINTLMGNPARGLLQYIPQTFGAYKVPGHGNINSGYDQLLAFFNNKNWRRDLPYGKRGWGPTGAKHYADGEFGIDTKQLAWIADGGWAESIISHDPGKKARSHRIWQQTGDALGFTDIYNNKDENKGPTEFTQNLTINSPKHLSPSEISRKNLQSLRRMAMEWGL